MSERKLWTEPKIKIGKVSYVWFRYYDDTTGKMKLIIKKGGVNAKHLQKSKIKPSLNALKQAIIYKLTKQGWNPITNEYAIDNPLYKQQKELEEMQRMCFKEAIIFAYEKKLPDWSRKSRLDFAVTKKYIIRSAEKAGLIFTRIGDFRRVHCLTLLEQLTKDRKLTPKGYNKYRTHLSSLLAKLEEYEIIEYNPVNKIKPKKVIKTIAYRPPSPTERALITENIKKLNYDYYRFISMIYGCALRPAEVAALRVKSIDIENQTILIYPQEKPLTEAPQETESKTKFWRTIPIPDWLFNLLNEFNLKSLNPEWYLFSKTYKPGPARLGRNRPTTTWKEIVKDQLKLNVDLYSLKKLAGDDMVKIQIQYGLHNLLALPQYQMGHTSSKMTENYVSEHTSVINKFLKQKMPEL